MAASEVSQTALWREATAIPHALARTLEQAQGFDELAALLGEPSVERVVATGNGAALYAAYVLWTAALAGEAPRPEVVVVPAGLLAAGAVRLRPGDRLLVVSSSGELRDVIELLERDPGIRYGAVTAASESTIAAHAAARAVVRVESQAAVTHTQAYCGNVVALLAVWARVVGDEALLRVVAHAPAACEAALALATFPAPPTPPRTAIAFAGGVAWPAALEAALLLKEVARVPAEGLETREGATSGMYALSQGDLAVSLPTGPDRLLEEAERTCRAAGADVVRLDGGALADPRLAAVSTFPAALALAIGLGLRAGHDVDSPAWLEAYHATARVPTRRSTTEVA
jgi:glucosamine--fructose-6-phosphate aminotransferase (isomerizing)